MSIKGYLLCIFVLGGCLLLIADSQGEVHTSPGDVNVTAKQNWYDTLRQDILKGYDKQSLPVQNHSDTVSIQLGVALIYVDLDILNSKFIVDCWLRFVWDDSKLSWDPESYGGITIVHMAADELWKPDIMLYNSADLSDINPLQPTNLLLYPTGSVLWVPPARLAALCEIHLHLWPWEEHECTLKFGSWTYDGFKIDLDLYNDQANFDMSDLQINNTKWEVIGNTGSKHTKYYSCCSEPYHDLEFTLKLRRRSPTYRALLIAPILVVVSLTLASFWLPPSAGERITIAGFNFLVVCLFLNQFGNTLPERADHTPFIVTFYSNTAVLIGVTIITSVIAISMSREKTHQTAPRMLKQILTGTIGKMLLLGKYIDLVTASRSHYGGVELSPAEDGPASADNQKLTRQPAELDSPFSYHHDWTLVAAFIDRIAFIVYCVVFAATMSSCF